MGSMIGLLGIAPIIMLRFAFVGGVAAWVLPSSFDTPPTETTQSLVVSFPVVSSITAPRSPLQEATSTWLSSTPPPPSSADIQLLRQAFAEFYGLDRDLIKAEQLLSGAVEAWKNQPDDEKAGLYRVRGDCYTLLGQADAAIADYSSAIRLLQTAEGRSKADEAELPAALQGRARALKSNPTATMPQLLQAADDYKLALKLSSREEWDTETELLEDGTIRNPYAAWEWGTVLRRAGKLTEAAEAHQLASDAFSIIGDKPRSAIAGIDAGIDAASSAVDGKAAEQAKRVLENAIAQTKGVEGRDVDLLQRTVAKEGEGRMALAALMWSQLGQRDAAEAEFGKACQRLDQLQDFASKRQAATTETAPADARLKYSIDDEKPPIDFSCRKFMNPEFLVDRLGWPDALQKKVIKLERLQP